MAQSVYSNLADFEATAQSAFYEQQAEAFDAFNAGTGGAIAYQMGDVTGNHPERGFWANRTTVARRDITNTSARTLAGNTQSTYKGINLFYQGADDVAVSHLSQASVNPTAYAAATGTKIARDKLFMAFTSTLAGLVGTLTKAAASQNDLTAASSNNTASIDNLLATKEKFGDMSMKLRGMIINSKPYFDLKQELGTTPGRVTEIGAGVVASDSLSDVLGLTTFVTDNTQLVIPATSNVAIRYRTLLLVEGAATMIEDETVPLSSTVNTEYNNALLQTVSEWNMSLWVEGFSHTAAGDNPADSALATTTNWTQSATSVKDTAGAVLISF